MSNATAPSALGRLRKLKKVSFFGGLSALLCFPCSPSCSKSPASTPDSTSHNSTKTIHYHTVKAKETQFHLLVFDQKDFNIEVADQPKGPGSQWHDAKTAARAHNAVVAINAGFFSDSGKPVGYAIDDGAKQGYLNKTSIGTGAFLCTENGDFKIIRRSLIEGHLNTEDPKKKANHLLQAGPFLIENQRSIKVKTSVPRPRSFIATNGTGKWMIGHVEKISMPDLVKALSELKVPDFKVHTALNLDGGRSCQLFIDSSIAGTDQQVTTFMNRQVRNFLVVKPVKK